MQNILCEIDLYYTFENLFSNLKGIVTLYMSELMSEYLITKSAITSNWTKIL